MNSLATPATGHYEFRDERGETLSIKAAADGGAFMLVPDTILRFSNETAPAMALAILEAAGVQSAPHDSASPVQKALNHLTEQVSIQRNQAVHAELTRRRDEMVQHLIVHVLGESSVTPYRDTSRGLQTAADIIIGLQDDAAEATL